MSKLRIASLGLLFSINAIQAAEELETKERTVRIQEIQLDIALNSTSVLCTAADYGAEMLKVNVPDLRFYTAFDHTNTGTGQPCVQGGQCSETNEPTSIISQGPSVLAPVKIERKIIAVINHNLKVCDQIIHEIVDIDIKGKNFHHEKFAELGRVTYEACVAL